MRHLITLLLINIATASLAFAADNAQSNIVPPAAIPLTEEDYTSLTDDASRADLFALVEQARKSDDELATESGSIVAFPFKGDFSFPDDVAFDDIANVPRENTTIGIDLSHYSQISAENFVLLKEQGVSFVYIKATQGTNYKDDKFKAFWPALGALPNQKAVMRGAYGFLSAGVDGRLQADRFVDYVNLHGGFKPNDLPPCVDLEWDVVRGNPDQWVGHDPQEIMDEVLAWLDEVERRTHRHPIVYTARSWWNGITQKHPEKRPLFARLNSYPIWTADYSASNRFKETPGVPMNRKWDVWQFTSRATLQSGALKGARFDANVFKGDEDTFRAIFTKAN